MYKYRDVIIITLLCIVAIILLLLTDSNAQMHNEELFDAEVTVGWFWEKLPVYMGFHAFGDTGEEGVKRWIHIEGIPMIITVMEFASGNVEIKSYGGLCNQLEQ